MGGPGGVESRVDLHQSVGHPVVSENEGEEGVGGVGQLGVLFDGLRVALRTHGLREQQRLRPALYTFRLASAVRLENSTSSVASDIGSCGSLA